MSTVQVQCTLSALTPSHSARAVYTAPARSSADCSEVYTEWALNGVQCTCNERCTVHKQCTLFASSAVYTVCILSRLQYKCTSDGICRVHNNYIVHYVRRGEVTDSLNYNWIGGCTSSEQYKFTHWCTLSALNDAHCKLTGDQCTVFIICMNHKCAHCRRSCWLAVH